MPFFESYRNIVSKMQDLTNEEFENCKSDEFVMEEKGCLSWKLFFF